jgi:hypothetical protein
MQIKLTPQAKSHLSTTIRALRERMVRDIRDAAEADFRLSVKAADAGLSEAGRIRRGRLEGYIDERVRAEKPKREKARTELRERVLREEVTKKAATLLNRLVLIRHMEALELIKPDQTSRGYQGV